MAIHDADSSNEQHTCFLCTLDPTHQSCATTQLVGTIVAVQERSIQGEKVAAFLLDTAGERIELHLDGHYYRSFVKALKALGDVIGHSNLRLHIYHLPDQPTTVESRGRSRLCYKGNSYTLAVLEPDTLLNITDLNQAEYCARQYLLNRLLPGTTSAATVRGNLIHYCFKELLKEYDRGALTPRQDESNPTVEAALHRHLEQAMELQSIDMALAGVAPGTMRAEVAPHLESLAQWFERERNTLWDMPAAYADEHETSGNQVRAETFLLAPEIGLRGRLDLFWQQAGRQRLLELKTGGAHGNLPKRDHRWQVYGYHALLTVRRDSKMKKALATLLYSGTPGSAQAFGIPATIREIQRVNETRNILVLSRVTGQPPSPPGVSRCSKCAMLESCQQVSELLAWEPPQPDPELLALAQARRAQRDPQTNTEPPKSRRPIPQEDRDFFNRYYQLLHQEGRTGEQQQSLLWQLPVLERIERGSAILGLEMQGQPELAQDGWKLVFRCTNTSELREGDEILLSNGSPITGETVSGTIMAINSEQVTVWTREQIAHPMLIDRYDNELVHVRTLQNLLRWQRVPAHLRDLVAGRVRPRFLAETVTQTPGFNLEQNLAVERAIQMQDYLLIHGPPGTGKTSVIAEIVKRLTQRGQRVMLAGFTNQAVDNMLKRLIKDGCTNFLRLGHERSVAEAIRPHLLKAQLTTARTDAETTTGPETDETAVHDILHTTPIVASTTATWSSDKYSASPAQTDGNLLENAGLYFDVAIIDEAGQLTIPAILGALRFARKFILVGDEKQLPPLVLNKEAAEQGLAISLFSYLKRLDEEYTQDRPVSISACVPLRVQYRMNRWIANFSSTVFYDRQLIAHSSIAHRRLTYTRKRTPAGENEAITRALDPTRPLAFLDTYDAYNDVHPGSKQSNTEARAVRALVAGLLNRGIALHEIGIIAPYRAQVANIRRYLFSADEQYGWPGLALDAPISVDTVDRFQGGERSVIIISFATQQEPPTESPRREFLTNVHRLNVALTRAQCKLLLVGNVSALENLPIFSRLITYCRSMKTLMNYTDPI